jgi:dTDP-4-amino-4,6-dideoxygalactose transaminase
VAEKVVPQIISLPMYAELTDAMVDEAAAAVIEAAK